MTRRFSIILTVALLAVAIGGCASQATKDQPASQRQSRKPKPKKASTSKPTTSSSPSLETIVSKAQTEVATLRANTGDTYSDGTVEMIDDHTIRYTLRLTESQAGLADPESLKMVMMKALKGSLLATFAARPNLTVQLRLLKADGSAAVDTTVTKKQVDALVN